MTIELVEVSDTGPEEKHAIVLRCTACTGSLSYRPHGLTTNDIVLTFQAMLDEHRDCGKGMVGKAGASGRGLRSPR